MKFYRRPIDARVRFLRHVSPCPVTGCWWWTASVRPARSPNAYGQFSLGDRVITQAHRAAYVLFVGPIPDDLFVLHRCDQKLCVNPAHLFLGTQRDNMLDAKSKGLLRRGATHPLAVLTEAQVLELLDAGRPLHQLPVSVKHQRQILRREKWSYLEVA